jgi:hypothetical protein
MMNRTPRMKKGNTTFVEEMNGDGMKRKSMNCGM